MGEAITIPEKFRILLVDNESDSRVRLRFLLEREGYEVAEVGNGEEALEKYLEIRPQLILVEAILPGIDGFKTCAHLRQFIHNGQTAVIMISELEDDKSIELAFEAGATDFFPKPYNWSLMRQRIRRLELEQRDQVQRLDHKTEETDRKRMEAAIKDSEQRLADIINFLPDATFVIDREGKVITWNKAIEVLTGVPMEKILGKGKYEYAIPFYGKRRPMLVDLLLRSNEDEEKNYSFLQKEENSVIAETFVPNLKGKQVIVWAKASRLYDQDGNLLGAIESIRDISHTKQMDQHLLQISLRDSLTGLYNRAYFLEELNRYENQKYNPVGVFILAVDGLRFINDTMGYDAGDVLLLAATNIIKKCFNGENILARVGGNEFAVLFANTSRSDMERVRRRIAESIEAYNVVGQKLLLSISVGFTFRGSASKTMFNLFQEAENSMYYEKIKRAESVRSLMVLE